MNYDKQRKLVKRLIAKTEKGDVEWKPSVREDSYQLSFSEYSLRINRLKKDQGSVDYEIEMINSDATVVDAFTDDDLDEGNPDVPWYVQMRDLFDSARRHALGAEAALNAILDKLDDEIPF